MSIISIVNNEWFCGIVQIHLFVTGSIGRQYSTSQLTLLQGGHDNRGITGLKENYILMG